MKNPNQTDLHHCANSSLCSVLKYNFQNTMAKLVFSADFTPIHLLQYQKKFFILSLTNPMTPFLLNQARFSEITFCEDTVTEQDIKEIIISKEPLSHPKPFSVAVYTGFSYIGVKNQASKKHTALIGWHQGTNSIEQSKTPPAINHLNADLTLHLFVTPSLNNQSIFLSVLNSNETHAKMCNLKNFYTNPHFTEGESQAIPKKEEKSEGRLLNQRFCICEHKETGSFTVPGNHSFKPIGELFLIPY
jgi:hypothetical protein